MTDRKAVVITVSDGVHSGSREDKSGDLLAQLVETAGFTVAEREVLPDVQAMLVAAFQRHAATPGVDLVVTTGGTGLGPRDVTPEATLGVIERQIPGMAEAMRAKSIEKTPLAMTSRQVVGVRGTTLIVNFPGSPKAVAQCFEVVEPVLHHVIDLIHGNTEHK
ncbi:MogA/MoaB family molybdenum cofactor biosynthesis protein [Alicyclobacillus dauci]|uniref:MogA/MoaB family molybdenum cofactor biosynthesis protein n=1 Tax=Alicyclobacillus dauci TaxID=1475485 RepID=A0ABY6Z571_9BACL|nr:MogA/MoaB family molybdenum cofactor biosynthesis protein [Alicyclobacillus dauci]WAH37668.1 MogA/MoaB family molybdenum cofactor biosynthesis protein [Alicyclobacillus dauci]